MWSRRRFDVGWADLACGLGCCLTSADPDAAAERCEGLWPEPDRMLACLSVRSGFDLLVSALSLPAGGEVLLSCVTVPDMPRILEHHQLVPVPVDLAPGTMAPTIEHLQQAYGPNTRAILVAHLFGGRIDLTPIAAFARQRRLLLIEDSAQAYAGCHDAGHPEADASLFSFGTIKANTTLGGAMLCVRNRELLSRMRSLQAAWPVACRWQYGRRLLKCGLLHLASGRPQFGLLMAMLGGCGCDYDRWLNHLVRGFPDPAFFSRIRRRPSQPLLAMMARRLRRYTVEHQARQAARGQFLLKCLGNRVVCPGAASAPHTFWAFPILAAEPRRMIAALSAAGFDATQGHSLCVVSTPGCPPRHQPAVARDVLRRIVFLPLYPEMPDKSVSQMAGVVLRHSGAERLVPRQGPWPGGTAALC